MSFKVIKDKSLTTWSILFVIIIFILQFVLLYKLYQSRMDMMRQDIELIFNQAYSIDLGKRLEYNRIREQNHLELLEQGKEVNIENYIKNTVYNKTKNIPFLEKNNFLFHVNILLEEDVSKQYPFKVGNLNVFVDFLLKHYSLSLPYNIVLFNSQNQKIISQTNSNLNESSMTISSKYIPLNMDGSRVIMIYVNPGFTILYDLGWLLLLSLILSIFCIYCLYYQLSTLSKQKQLAKSKNSFFSEVSHEMVRPLSILNQTLDSLRNEKNINDLVKRDRYITFAQLEIEKMAKKTDMVLSLARDDEGMFELNIKQFDLVKLVYDEVDSILIIPPKEVDFNIENQLKDNPSIYADIDHIEQILSNLIGNAIKYSDRYLSITIKLYRDKKNVYISVKDTGYGIADDVQQFIFEKYSRVDRSHTKKGHGIGLNYVKRVVTKHGGDISLNSVIGEGSEFIVRLPQGV